MQHTGQDDRRDFGQSEHTASDNLPRALKREQRDGQQLSPSDIIGDGVQASIHDPTLYYRRGPQDDECLKKERGDES